MALLSFRQWSRSKPSTLHGDLRLDLRAEGCIVVQVVKNENALQAEGRACIKARRHESGCHAAECQKAMGLWAM